MFDQFQPVNNTSLRTSSETKYAEFKLLLERIYLCYEKMVLTEKSLPDDENEITRILVTNYMKDPFHKKNTCGITGYRFEREVTEDHSIIEYGKTKTGRVDIKILPTEGINNDNDQAYFIIECKRLNNVNLRGKTGLNAEYIKNGIARFINNKQYTAYYDTNGMMAYIVKELNIDLNINNINYLIDTQFKDESKTVNRITALTTNALYTSDHLIDENKTLKLYHMMLDVSCLI